MVNRRIATAVGGTVIGAMALMTAPAYASAATTNTTAAKAGTTDARWSKHKDTKIVGFSASPSRVRKGARLTIRGTLRHRSGHEAGIGRERIQIYFQANGSHSWRRVDSTQTRSNGAFSIKIRTYKSGTWSARFTDNRLGDSKADDFVKVVG